MIDISIQSDANHLLKFCHPLNEKLGADKIEIKENLINFFSFGSSAELSPMAAFFGGLVAQEVLKVMLLYFTNLSFTKIYKVVYYLFYFRRVVANLCLLNNIFTLILLNHCL